MQCVRKHARMNARSLAGTRTHAHARARAHTHTHTQSGPDLELDPEMMDSDDWMEEGGGLVRS